MFISFIFVFETKILHVTLFPLTYLTKLAIIHYMICSITHFSKNITKNFKLSSYLDCLNVYLGNFSFSLINLKLILIFKSTIWHKKERVFSSWDPILKLNKSIDNICKIFYNYFIIFNCSCLKSKNLNLSKIV